MANYPLPLKQRDELNLRLGIKSSLSQLRPVLASLYVLYCANDKNVRFQYSQEKQSNNGFISIILDSSLKEKVNKFYSNNYSQYIENSPLFTSQLEALQVGLELFFHICKIDFVKAGISERTGLNRYDKSISFSTNMLLLDLFLSSYSTEDVNKLLLNWLQDKEDDSEIERKLKIILNTFTEETQYKIRDNKSNEIIFNQEGVYSEILSSNAVASNDSKEQVGPYRVLKAYISGGLHPFLIEYKQTFNLRRDISKDVLSRYTDMVDTSLNLITKRSVVTQEVEVQKNWTHSYNPIIAIPLQQIYYGAPGTGKSHEVKKLTGELSVDNEDRDLPNVFRTTFHPDTDYASFVGCYKPSMQKTGKKHQVDGKDVDDEEIIYEFVPQTFTDAYVYAYKNPTEPTYLVIEEINRGNCAQIFGDLFQLLDRKNGVSEYRIKSDKDLAKYLYDELGTDADGIKDGKLRLPANLNILATMNTSDQSLFPIDSAFKRRWEWKYTPIAQGKDKSGNLMKWHIEGQEENSWWTFIQGINEVIDVTTHSEDKKLGFFFCKDQGGEIKKETFVNKVIFYLWNDVFKVYGFKSEIFDKKGKDDKTEKITFKSFYKDDGSVNDETMSVFVKNVMAKAPKENSNDDAPNESEEISEGSETEA